MLERLALAIKNRRIRISISCGRSTDYVDEYYITDIEGNVIHPWDFKWSGAVFQLVEEETDVPHSTGGYGHSKRGERK